MGRMSKTMQGPAAAAGGGPGDPKAALLRSQVPIPPDGPPAPVPPVPPAPPGPDLPEPPIEDPPPGPDTPMPGDPEMPPAGDPPGAPPPIRVTTPPKEIGGPAGPEPTRYGDWERKGRVSDF